jgi:hypothetical protein
MDMRWNSMISIVCFLLHLGGCLTSEQGKSDPGFREPGDSFEPVASDDCKWEVQPPAATSRLIDVMSVLG